MVEDNRGGTLARAVPSPLYEQLLAAAVRYVQEKAGRSLAESEMDQIEAWVRFIQDPRRQARVPKARRQLTPQGNLKIFRGGLEGFDDQAFSIAKPPPPVSTAPPFLAATQLLPIAEQYVQSQEPGPRTAGQKLREAVEGPLTAAEKAMVEEFLANPWGGLPVGSEIQRQFSPFTGRLRGFDSWAYRFVRGQIPEPRGTAIPLHPMTGEPLYIDPETTKPRFDPVVRVEDGTFTSEERARIRLEQEFLAGDMTEEQFYEAHIDLFIREWLFVQLEPHSEYTEAAQIPDDLVRQVKNGEGIFFSAEPIIKAFPASGGRTPQEEKVLWYQAIFSTASDPDDPDLNDILQSESGQRWKNHMEGQGADVVDYALGELILDVRAMPTLQQTEDRITQVLQKVHNLSADELETEGVQRWRAEQATRLHRRARDEALRETEMGDEVDSEVVWSVLDTSIDALRFPGVEKVTAVADEYGALVASLHWVPESKKAFLLANENEVRKQHFLAMNEDARTPTDLIDWLRTDPDTGVTDLAVKDVPEAHRATFVPSATAANVTRILGEIATTLKDRPEAELTADERLKELFLGIREKHKLGQTVLTEDTKALALEALDEIETELATGTAKTFEQLKEEALATFPSDEQIEAQAGALFAPTPPGMADMEGTFEEVLSGLEERERVGARKYLQETTSGFDLGDYGEADIEQAITEMKATFMGETFVDDEGKPAPVTDLYRQYVPAPTSRAIRGLAKTPSAQRRIGATSYGMGARLEQTSKGIEAASRERLLQQQQQQQAEAERQRAADLAEQEAARKAAEEAARKAEQERASAVRRRRLIT